MQFAPFPACQPELEPFDYARTPLSAPHDTQTARLAPVSPVPGSRNDINLDIQLDPPAAGDVEWVAAAPPDHRTSYGGSALPFPSAQHAFTGTPNTGSVKASDGGRKAQLVLQYPNSYYTNLGSHLVPPTVYLRYQAKGSTRPVHTAVKMSHGVPYRSLAYPASRTGPEFYGNIASGALPVRSQERILLDSAYPSTNTEAPDFWGLKPAV